MTQAFKMTAARTISPALQSTQECVQSLQHSAVQARPVSINLLQSNCCIENACRQTHAATAVTIIVKHHKSITATAVGRISARRGAGPHPHNQRQHNDCRSYCLCNAIVNNVLCAIYTMNALNHQLVESCPRGVRVQYRVHSKCASRISWNSPESGFLFA